MFSIALQGNVTDIIKPEVPVSKTIRFSVFASTNYASALYHQSKAKVLLSIWKYKGKDQKLLWSEIIDEGKLNKYPLEEDALFREIYIPQVYEKSERLVLSYKIIYNSKGSELSYEKGYYVPAGDKPKELPVAL